MRERVVWDIELDQEHVCFELTTSVTYSVKFNCGYATLLSGLKFKVLNAVLGHARHLGHRYSPTVFTFASLAA